MCVCYCFEGTCDICLTNLLVACVGLHIHLCIIKQCILFTASIRTKQLEYYVHYSERKDIEQQFVTNFVSLWAVTWTRQGRLNVCDSVWQFSCFIWMTQVRSTGWMRPGESCNKRLSRTIFSHKHLKCIYKKNLRCSEDISNCTLVFNRREKKKKKKKKKYDNRGIQPCPIHIAW